MNFGSGAASSTSRNHNALTKNIRSNKHRAPGHFRSNVHVFFSKGPRKERSTVKSRSLTISVNPCWTDCLPKRGQWLTSEHPPDRIKPPSVSNSTAPPAPARRCCPSLCCVGGESIDRSTEPPLLSRSAHFVFGHDTGIRHTT